MQEGSRKERTRARTYLKWLLKQRSGSVYVDDLRDPRLVLTGAAPTRADADFGSAEMLDAARARVDD